MRWLALLLLLLPCLARAGASDDLRRAKDLFEYGEYEEARLVAETLLVQNVLAEDDQLIDANRIAALAWFYSSEPDRLAKAERYFLQLLSIEPEYRLDPFFTPPAALQYFEDVKKAHEEQLAPIREQRRLAKEARRAEEEARRRFLAEQKRPPEPEPTTVRTVERHHRALVFLPLGVGQFQNGDERAGWTLAGVQAVAGLTSVICYVTIEQLRDDGGFSPGRMGTVRTLDTVKWASAALFYAAWAYGVTDAWLKFEPATVRDVQAPAQPESDALEAERPEAPAAEWAPHVELSPDGGAFGLSMRF